MAAPEQGDRSCGESRSWRAFAALLVCTLVGACAQSQDQSLSQMLADSERPPQGADAGKSELAVATEYWGKEYAKEPSNLEAALGYAKNLKAMGEKKRALSVLQQVSVYHGNSRELASEYGRLALEFDQVNLAGRLLAAAEDPADPDWRVISGRGTVLAKQGKYKDAIPYFERALSYAPDHPSLLSNLALAHAMNGDPKRAETLLRQAAAGDRNSLKIRQNLALVLGLQGKYEEAKLLASRDLPAESAAENTDYLRRLVKLEPQKPPASEVEQKVIAEAKRPAKAPPAETDNEADEDTAVESAPEAAHTSEATTKARATETAQVVESFRTTIMPEASTAEWPTTTAQAGAETAWEPRLEPSFETAFNIAQWSTETTTGAKGQ
jgi:Flp pilus assembly protein TadD